MTNHPNRKITPLRRAFLMAALADDGRVMKGSYNYYAGDMSLKYRMGEALCEMGLIARVTAPGSANTVKWRMGYLYMITDAGRAAIS